MYCGEKLTCTGSLKFRRFELPVFGGVKLYEGQVDDSDGDMHKIIGEIVRNKKDPGKLALRNLSDTVWKVTLPDNSSRTVDNGGVMPLIKGFVLSIDTAEGTVN